MLFVDILVFILKINMGGPRKYSLNENLKALGMSTAFDDLKADFSGMADLQTTGENLFISSIIHQAYVKVDEKGTEAAAATAVVAKFGSAMPRNVFRADHPFIFIIQERETGHEKLLKAEGVFVEIGLLPNSASVKTLVALNDLGEVIIDCSCRTDVEGFFGAGDVTTVPHKQIIISAGEGAKAALSAYDYLMKHAFV